MSTLNDPQPYAYIKSTPGFPYVTVRLAVGYYITRAVAFETGPVRRKKRAERRASPATRTPIRIQHPDARVDGEFTPAALDALVAEVARLAAQNRKRMYIALDYDTRLYVEPNGSIAIARCPIAEGIDGMTIMHLLGSGGILEDPDVGSVAVESDDPSTVTSLWRVSRVKPQSGDGGSEPDDVPEAEWTARPAPEGVPAVLSTVLSMLDAAMRADVDHHDDHGDYVTGSEPESHYWGRSGHIRALAEVAAYLSSCHPTTVELQSWSRAWDANGRPPGLW